MKRVVGLTGTPAPNGLIDLWSQVYLIDRGVRLEKTVTAYRQRYFIPAQTNGHIVYSYKLRENSERLISEKIKDVCMSMKAKDYLQLPEATYNNISIKMSEKLKKQYRDFEKEKVLELFEGDTQISVANAATLANKLLQFANGAIYDEEHNFHEIHELKLDALKELIEDANGKPVLVAWSFQHDRDRILHHLRGYKPRELKTPKDIADWNDGKIQLLLAHPASAGHGLNLQAGGNIIVWYGLTWSLELYQQFNARLHRQGQKQAVIIHHIALSGTYDTNVLNALTRKDMTQNALMRSIKARVEQYTKSTSG
jgi:SNF2 family DNA or RNA helicase